MTTERWPPLSPETKVVTTRENPDVDDWTEEALASRQWGVRGTVIIPHYSHGLCYEVRHEDGTVGFYDQSELMVMKICTKGHPFVSPRKDDEFWEHQNAYELFPDIDLGNTPFRCPNCGLEFEQDLR